MRLEFNDQFEIAQKAAAIPLYVGVGYASGNILGQGLGFNNESQKRLGTMSAINAGLTGTATLFDQLNKRKEVKDRMNQMRAMDYQNNPYDNYAYDSYSNTQTDGNYFKEGGIPDRYKNMGFTKVGQKKNSTRDGKKWMVLAQKGDQYKVVHGGDSSMQDFSQHNNEDRREKFWNRMGGKNSAKAKDPFSPLYWHKRLNKWEDGGIPVSEQGLYEFPNQPVTVPSNRITMKGIDYPVMAYPDNDQPTLMRPNQEYKFPNSRQVLEIPYQGGGEVEDSYEEEIYDAMPTEADDAYDMDLGYQPLNFPSSVPQEYNDSNAPKGGSIATSHNNPGNIKMGNFAAGYGATPGRRATDGGVFAVFPDVNVGLKAQRDLFKGKNYRGLSVDQAMRRWSNSGYGGEIYPNIANKTMAELSEQELQELQRRQIKREDGAMYRQIFGQ